MTTLRELREMKNKEPATYTAEDIFEACAEAMQACGGFSEELASFVFHLLIKLGIGPDKILEVSGKSVEAEMGRLAARLEKRGVPEEDIKKK